MKFEVNIDDELAAAICAHHGMPEEGDDVKEYMRSLVEFALVQEAKNAMRAKLLSDAAVQVEAFIELTLPGKFSVTPTEGDE